MVDNEIYLDFNATSPPLPEVVEEMADVAKRCWGNPASVHAVGRQAREVLETARETLASLIGFEPRDVIFTASATEANNLALHQAAELALTHLEHPSVSKLAELRESQRAGVTWLDCENGRLSPDAVRAHLETHARPELVVVAVSAANHETGVVQPLAEIADITRRHGARLHVDGAQWLGKADPWTLACADSVAVSAHKLGGPKGIGALAFRGKPPAPLIFGGGQERGIRPGTQDAVLASGFRLALSHCRDASQRRARLALLRDHLESAVQQHASVNGAGAPRLPHVSNLSFLGFPGPEMAAALDLHGIRASSGSACSAGTSEPSPVIEAMEGAERARTSVRFSLGEPTDGEQIDRTIAAIFQILGV
jgi:cysteine desulfurase